MINDVTSELELCPVERRKEDVKFLLGKVDNMGGSLFTKLFKVELGHGTKGFKGGLQGKWGQGSDNIGAGVDGVGLEGIGADKGDARVGK